MKTIAATALLLVLTGTMTSPSQGIKPEWPADVIERYPRLAPIVGIESMGRLCGAFASAQRDILRDHPNSDFRNTGMERHCPEME